MEPASALLWAFACSGPTPEKRGDSYVADTSSDTGVGTSDTATLPPPLVRDSWRPRAGSTWNGSIEWGVAGYHVDVADFDGQPGLEIAVGAPWFPLQGWETGWPPDNQAYTRAYVLGAWAGEGSGPGYTVTVLGAEFLDEFATRVYDVGDVDGDGIEDIAATDGSNGYGTWLFRKPLVSSSDPTAAFASIAGLGDSETRFSDPSDLNGDGISDLATSAGIFFGPITGQETLEGVDVQFIGHYLEDIFVGDLTGDADPEVVAGERSLPSGGGGAVLLDVLSPSIDLGLDAVATWTGNPKLDPNRGERAGARVHGGHDLDGDGLADLYLPADRGYIATDLIGGALSDTAWAAFEPEGFGLRFDRPPWGHEAAMGDFDGDGDADIALGLIPEESAAGPADPKTAARLAEVVAVFTGPVPPGTFTESDADVVWYGSRWLDDGFGSALDAGDLDGDGREDLIVGAPLDASLAAEGGAVHVLWGAGL